MKKVIALVLLCAMFAGCQQSPSSQNAAMNQRQEAAKKLFAQSILLLQQKDLKGAVASLEASIKLDPTDPNPYLMLGQILLKAEQFDQAVAFLDQTSKMFPDNGTVFYMLSIANKMSGKKLPAVLAARHSFEIFKAAGDAENAKASAILLEEVIQSGQESDKAPAAADKSKVTKTTAIK